MEMCWSCSLYYNRMSDVEHANYARMTRPGLEGGLCNELVALLSTELRKTNKCECTETIYVLSRSISLYST